MALCNCSTCAAMKYRGYPSQSTVPIKMCTEFNLPIHLAKTPCQRDRVGFPAEVL